MTRHRLHLVLGGLLLATAAGCDSLEETPRDFLGPENFYRTAEDAVAAANGGYTLLYGQSSIAGWRNWSILEYTGQALSANNAADQRATEHMDRYTFDPSTRYFYMTYGDSYSAIARLNAAVANIPPIAMDEGLKNRLLGEVRFLRALYYFNLVRAYGGVPLHTEPVDNIEAARKPRASADEVYALIVEDLQFAEQHLPTSYPANEYGRATQGAARSLLGKVYLTRGVLAGAFPGAPTGEAGDLTNAVEKLRQVVQSGEYALVDDYKSLFYEATERNSEVIFPVVHIQENFFGATIQNYITPPLTNWAGGQWGNQNVELPFYYSYHPSDTRRDASWLAEYTDRNGVVHRWNADPALNTHYKNAPTPAKYLIRHPLPHIQWGPLDYSLIRYADVLLMLAEAINEQGNGPTAEAYAAVNAVRARAKVPALPEGLGYAQFRESLYWERLWELTQEHHGYFDAQRFWDLHVAAVRANSAQKGSFAPNAVPPEMAIQDHHRLFPIPQQAIDRNSELVQNPGY